ncbi:amidase [Pelomicrobium sp. G1]|uniref:amidase n=1 Tax=unclassified Pelomicrobium TaxID=2815318 RepID=UPI003F777B25
MPHPADLSATAAVAAIRKGRLTSEALVRACLERIAEREPEVRAFVDLQADVALARARALDARGPRDDEPLFGVPVAIKEIFDVAGYRCAWGTPIHSYRIPSADAPAVARLKKAGAVVLGTVVSTEYAVAAAGPTTNPHDPSRSPGGSSSGSAAAVAAGMVPLALGSQSIGSIVRPSIYCGVLGLKPTKGAISIQGCMPLAEELDHAGPIARTADDIATACRVLFGREPGDPYSRPIAPPDDATAPPSHVLEAIGPLRSRVGRGSAAAVQQAVSSLRKAGLPVSRIELPPDFDRIEWVAHTLLCRGIARHHGTDRDLHGERMSEPMRALVDRGRAVTDGEHARALRLARQFGEQLAAMLTPGTVMVTAAVDDVAPPIEEGTGSPLLQGLATVTGLPALAVPCARHDGLPVGVQLVAGHGQEGLLLSAARKILAASS